MARKESLLTTSSGFSNYRGVLNLVIILLLLSNARAALENLIKYGLLVDPFSWFQFFRNFESRHLPAILILLGLCGHIFISYLLELILAKPYKANKKKTDPESELLITKDSTSSLSSSSPFSKQQQHSTTELPQQNQELRSRRPVETPATANETQNGGKLCCSVNLNDELDPLMRLLVQIVLNLNLFLVVSWPPLIVISNETHPFSASHALLAASLTFLKLTSYHMVNFWSRDIRKPESEYARTTKSFLKNYVPPSIEFGLDDATPPTPAEKVTRELKQTTTIELMLTEYPANVTLYNMVDFITVPTLCYELKYARTSRIRKRFLFKRILELIILFQIDLALVQQWIVPTVENSIVPFREMNFTRCVERLLKLAIPNHIIWLIWFYFFFHSLLNICAEITKFADREFYRDWWNSESVYYFWANWNIPVHKWCARHLYVPAMSLGMSRCQASTAVFFASAFFHEYLVSVPLKLFRLWAFTGMLMQLPLAMFVSTYFNNHFANVAVWVSIIIGQPLCILMYYHDYYVIHHPVFNATAIST